jgi:hypothetical protein
MPEHKLPWMPEDAGAAPLRGKPILLAVEDVERLERILEGHELTVPKSIDQAKAELQKRKFAMLSDVAIEGLDHAVKAMLANAFLNLRKFPDDGSGNARVRRIIDYLILIDGDMHGGFEAVHEKR